LVAGGEAGAGHALAQAAFGEEIPFQPADLLVEQAVGLVDEADDDISHHFRWASFDEGPIGLGGRTFVCAELPDVEGFAAVTAGAEEIPVIFQQFFARLARAILVSLISVSLDVLLARLPSRIFCLPERAAWIIWSWVRLRLPMKRSQKQVVAAKTIRALREESRFS